MVHFIDILVIHIGVRIIGGFKPLTRNTRKGRRQLDQSRAQPNQYEGSTKAIGKQVRKGGNCTIFVSNQQYKRVPLCKKKGTKPRAFGQKCPWNDSYKKG